MGILTSVLTVVQVLAALGVIVLVLLQHGKGADMGAAFGSGASGSLFGATGSANFLSRLTGGAAAVFFISTLALSYLANQGLVARSPSSELEKRLSTGVTVEKSSVPANSVTPATPAAGSAAPAPAPAAGAATPAPTAVPVAPAVIPANPAKGNEIPK